MTALGAVWITAQHPSLSITRRSPPGRSAAPDTTWSTVLNITSSITLATPQSRTPVTTPASTRRRPGRSVPPRGAVRRTGRAALAEEVVHARVVHLAGLRRHLARLAAHHDADRALRTLEHLRPVVLRDGGRGRSEGGPVASCRGYERDKQVT